ncbi:hypothetical protein NONO_c59650 [Nocardia nova SH22a]|uniref:Uncharacterized protein n=1 Tax=Nocardia nova SH22a TaxID=1415166 RepID=W5TU61_9NOCA|nr:hypothetical protein NONO_c59650 [Nocardia nova SH22a]
MSDEFELLERIRVWTEPRTLDEIRRERLRPLDSMGALHDSALILCARGDSRSAPGIEGESET